MTMRLRPKFRMALLSKIEDEIWKEYKSYSKVEVYLNEFHEDYYDERGFPDGENIKICRKMMVILIYQKLLQPWISIL
jgi:hypothetical protein